MATLDDSCRVTREFSVDAVMRSGKPFHADDPGALTVRYSIAGWFADCETLPLADDGSLTVQHPLPDDQSGVRHVLQHRLDDEVIAPERVRRAVGERSHALAQELAVA
jgi:predicted DNA-binding transcriptional regulator YafY